MAGRLLTVDESADYLGPQFGVRGVRRLVAERRVPVVRINRRVFIRPEALDALIAANESPATMPPLRAVPTARRTG